MYLKTFQQTVLQHLKKGTILLLTAICLDKLLFFSSVSRQNVRVPYSNCWSPIKWAIWYNIIRIMPNFDLKAIQNLMEEVGPRREQQGDIQQSSILLKTSRVNCLKCPDQLLSEPTLLLLEIITRLYLQVYLIKQLLPTIHTM